MHGKRQCISAAKVSEDNGPSEHRWEDSARNEGRSGKQKFVKHAMQDAEKT